MKSSRIREAYTYLVSHTDEYDELTSNELETLAFKLEVMAMDRNKGIEYEYNQDTQ